MKKLEYTVSFATPAFLGNAEQQAQWRTPPFKALVRQWWRVVHAPQVRYNVDILRVAEDHRFGAASDDGKRKSHRSLVRLRLSHWDGGSMTQWPAAGPTVIHPEVKFPVASELYLGFGPLENDKATKSAGFGQSKSSGSRRTAIDDRVRATLMLMVPLELESEIRATLQLAAWFGTLGSRSRNGWGALQMVNSDLKPLTRDNLEAQVSLQMLDECLGEEWPHAIGKDKDGPLVWKTRVTGDWRAVMKELATLKIKFRTQFKFNSGGPTAKIERRHVLAYPITNHNPNAWGAQKRLANQIRFKVARTNSGKFEGVIVHLPCKMPDALLGEASRTDQEFLRSNELAVWQAVHAVLDQHATRLA